jgi:hypothetical protein
MPWYLVPKELMAYVISTGSESGMDDLLLKWVLFEWLRDCKKEQAHAEIVSLKEISNCIANLFNFQRLIPFLSLRSLAISSRVLKKRLSMERLFRKTPRLLIYMR